MKFNFQRIREKGQEAFTSIQSTFQIIANDLVVQILFVLVYALTFFNYVQWGDLQKPLHLNDDFPQHLIWLYKYQENFFQPNDIYVEMSGLIQPWGYAGLTYFLSLFFDPITISKYFPVLLLVFYLPFYFFIVEKNVFGLALAIGGMIFDGQCAF